MVLDVIGISHGSRKVGMHSVLGRHFCRAAHVCHVKRGICIRLKSSARFIAMVST